VRTTTTATATSTTTTTTTTTATSTKSFTTAAHTRDSAGVDDGDGRNRRKIPTSSTSAVPSAPSAPSASLSDETAAVQFACVENRAFLRAGGGGGSGSSSDLVTTVGHDCQLVSQGDGGDGDAGGGGGDDGDDSCQMRCLTVFGPSFDPRPHNPSQCPGGAFGSEDQSDGAEPLWIRSLSIVFVSSSTVTATATAQPTGDAIDSGDAACAVLPPEDTVVTESKSGRSLGAVVTALLVLLVVVASVSALLSRKVTR
jgi:hypothetical protein